MNQKTFSNGVERGNFLASIDVIPYAYDAILKTSSTFELHTHPSEFKVLAFNCPSDYTTRFLSGAFSLVSSENLKVVDFIPTEVNPSFTINEAAVVLFEHLSVELKKLEHELINTRLVITGWSVGGYIAILFALWLHHLVDVEKSNDSWVSKRPICITFGSPLVGDEALQRAIAERPQWKSCFLNVVAKMDPVSSLFSSSSAYKPFGTYLFINESGGCTSFEDHDLILAILDAMASSSAGNLQIHDYKNDLSSIKRKVLYRGVSEFGEFNFNLLRAGIALQLMEVGVLDAWENNSWNVLMKKMEAKIIKSKRNIYEPAKKLNDSKISLTYMEWYMKGGRLKGGYYDRYKNAKSKKEIESQQEIVKHKRALNQYWKKFVEEKDRMPQEEGAKLRTRWLLAGNNYRRIVEPLDIADHYKKGEKAYIANREKHYKLLEKWLIEAKRDSNPSPRTKEVASLTEDSCFWAHVEEALISLENLKNGGLSSNAAASIVQELERFEADLMGAINKRSLTPDIFLDGSSFRRWWSEYKAYKGSSYASEFAQYMNKEAYNSYK